MLFSLTAETWRINGFSVRLTNRVLSTLESEDVMAISEAGVALLISPFEEDHNTLQGTSIPEASSRQFQF